MAWEVNDEGKVLFDGVEGKRVEGVAGLFCHVLMSDGSDMVERVTVPPWTDGKGALHLTTLGLMSPEPEERDDGKVCVLRVKDETASVILAPGTWTACKCWEGSDSLWERT